MKYSTPPLRIVFRGAATAERAAAISAMIAAFLDRGEMTAVDPVLTPARNGTPMTLDIERKHGVTLKAVSDAVDRALRQAQFGIDVAEKDGLRGTLPPLHQITRQWRKDGEGYSKILTCFDRGIGF